jgi:hypothetical protein
MTQRCKHGELLLVDEESTTFAFETIGCTRNKSHVEKTEVVIFIFQAGKLFRVLTMRGLEWCMGVGSND